MISRTLELFRTISGILKCDNFNKANQRWYEPNDDIRKTLRFFDRWLLSKVLIDRTLDLFSAMSNIISGIINQINYNK